MLDETADEGFNRPREPTELVDSVAEFFRGRLP
jgi:hypothetical protein